MTDSEFFFYSLLLFLAISFIAAYATAKKGNK